MASGGLVTANPGIAGVEILFIFKNRSVFRSKYQVQDLSAARQRKLLLILKTDRMEQTATDRIHRAIPSVRCRVHCVA